MASGEFKLALQSGNAQFGSKSTILALWPWNLTDYLEEQWGTFSKQHKAFCIISSPYVNSNWSYGLEAANWGHDFCGPDLWPLTLTFCMDIVSLNGNITSENFRMIRWQEHCQKGVTDGQTDRQTDRQTEISVLRNAWSQLKKVWGSGYWKSDIDQALPHDSFQILFVFVLFINGWFK